MVIITQLNHVRPLQLDFERTWAIISVVVLVEVHCSIPVVYYSSSKHLLVIRGLYLAGYIVDRNLALPKNNHGSANEHISQALQT